MLIPEHHCRNCGEIFCGDCANHLVSLPQIGEFDPCRLCDKCFEVWELNPPVDDPNVERYIRSSSGMLIYTHRWLTEGQNRGTVILLHGLAEHINNYDHFAKALAAKGFAVFGLDHAGHGRSQGSRLVTPEPQQFVRDVLEYARLVREEFPLTGPFVLMGHSFGSLVAINTVLKSPKTFDALITSGTYSVQPFGAPPSFVTPILTGPVASLFPSLKLAAIDNSKLSHDAAYTVHAQADPWRVRSGVTASAVAYMSGLLDSLEGRLHKIKLPLLAMHGADDTIIPPEGTLKLYNTARSKNKSHKIFPGMYHEILQEVDKQQVYEFVFSFLDMVCDLHSQAGSSSGEKAGDNNHEQQADADNKQQAE